MVDVKAVRNIQDGYDVSGLREGNQLWKEALCTA